MQVVVLLKTFRLHNVGVRLISCSAKTGVFCEGPLATALILMYSDNLLKEFHANYQVQCDHHSPVSQLLWAITTPNKIITKVCPRVLRSLRPRVTMTTTTITVEHTILKNASIDYTLAVVVKNAPLLVHLLHEVKLRRLVVIEHADVEPLVVD